MTSPSSLDKPTLDLIVNMLRKEWYTLNDQDAAGLGGGNANIIQRIIEENTQDLEVVYHHWK